MPDDREAHHHPFGADTFGRAAEVFARWFGTPGFIAGQTAAIGVWILLNTVAWVHHWDPRPWIMLNLVFSTQAAYAAPLILLAQTRQANRDKLAEEHRGRLEDQTNAHVAETHRLLEQNTGLTRTIHRLLRDNTSLTEAIGGLVQELHDRGRPLAARPEGGNQ